MYYTAIDLLCKYESETKDSSSILGFTISLNSTTKLDNDFYKIETATRQYKYVVLFQDEFANHNEIPIRSYTPTGSPSDTPTSTPSNKPTNHPSLSRSEK